MKTRKLLFALLIIVVLSASACAPAAPTEASQTDSEPSGKIVFAYPGDESELEDAAIVDDERSR